MLLPNSPNKLRNNDPMAEQIFSIGTRNIIAGTIAFSKF